MKLIAILMLFLLMTGCHPLACPWNWGYSQLESEPSQERLVGQYKLTESSNKFLMDNGFTNKDYRLELIANGQFKFINGPDLIFDRWGESKKELINKEGKWHVSCDESYGCMINFENNFVEPLCMKDGSIMILITIGDGDECRGIVYEKID